jgi:hypothetical protein
MTGKEQLGDHGFRQIIATLAAKDASGRLEVLAGATPGALLFYNGKLVDARMSNLTGFQAVNAIASLVDARFHFDPSVAPPVSSSITASERLVLKQFFGVDTVDARDYVAPINTPHVAEPHVEALNIASNVAPSRRRSWVPYAAAAALGVLVIAIAFGAVLLRREFRQRNAQLTTVRTEPVASVATDDTVDDKPVATTEKSKAADLNGTWTVVNTVQATSYKSFQNLQIGFVVSISQNGTTFTATGRKVSENGRKLPAGSRTPIQLKGIINGDRVEATFSEDGITRRTNGKFVWKINRAGGGLSGTFASSAAQTSGKSTASRQI